MENLNKIVKILLKYSKILKEKESSNKKATIYPIMPNNLSEKDLQIVKNLGLVIKENNYGGEFVFKQFYPNVFQYCEDSLDGNTNSRFYICCANINRDDTWVWKWNNDFYNFTPIWSTEYGDSSIPFEKLEKYMLNASKWLESKFEDCEKFGDLKPYCYLLKID